MSFKRRLKKEREKEEARSRLKGELGTLQMEHDDAKRFNEIGRRVDEIEKADIINAETDGELARLSREIEAIRAKYRRAK